MFDMTQIPTKYLVSSAFSGVFPHKGVRCARLKGLPGGTRWVPIGEGLALVEPRYSGAGYLPAGAVVDGDKLAKASLAFFYGQHDGRLYFYPRRVLPIQMACDWKAFPEDDGLRAGDVIIRAESGDEHRCAHHMVVTGIVR